MYFIPIPHWLLTHSSGLASVDQNFPQTSNVATPPIRSAISKLVVAHFTFSLILNI